MQTDWQTFLQTQGAHIEDGWVLDFGVPGQEATVAMDGNIITALPFLSVVRVTGTDATGFLHGQFSSDVQNMPEGGIQLSAWCNPKGQVVVNFIIVRFADEFFLLLPDEMKDGFIKRLRMYILRADVTLEDCSNSFPCLGIKHKAGDQPTILEIAGRLSSHERATRDNGLVMLHLPVNRNRVIIFGPVQGIETTWSEMQQTYSRVGSHYWQLFDILDGLPWIHATTTESFLPQLLNMDQLQAVSFNKGCFPGQEIIARLHYKGKTKQQMIIASLDDGTDIKPGMKIYQNNKEQSIGTIINCAIHPVMGMYILAVLDTDHGAPDQLILKDNHARFVQISIPSYFKLS